MNQINKKSIFPIILKPRLNYHFSLSEFWQGLVGIWHKADESELHEYLSADRTYFYNHARTALRVALSSLGLHKGAGIALSAFNCLTVFNAVDLAGYKPIFVDITDGFQIDMADFRKKRGLFSAVIVSHLFGIPCKSILAIRKEFPELPVIEDCAHSFGSMIDGKLTGSFGDFATYSYGMAKFPSVRDGGFLLVNRDRFIPQVEVENSKLRSPTVWAEVKNLAMGLVMSCLGKPFIYKYLTKPFLKRIESKKDLTGKYSIQESTAYKSNKYIYMHKLSGVITQIVGHKKTAAAWLKEMGREVIVDQDCNYFMMPVLTDDRDAMIRKYEERGIELGAHFSKSIIWAGKFGYKPGNCPNTEIICEKILVFPTYYDITSRLKS